MPTHNVLYRRWIIAVLVAVLLTPVYPATPGLADSSGWHSPSANVAASGGDNDGFEVNPENAYSDGGSSAANYSNGNGSSRSDYHWYSNYGFDIPPGSTIQGIRVRLDWWLDDASDNSRMGIRLSWDGGTSWSDARNDNVEITSEHTAYLGGTSDTWGRTTAWEAEDFSDGNFLVEVECYSNIVDAHDFYLDWVPVEVTYSEPPPPALSINDVTVTEGNGGTKDAIFTVSLSAASWLTVTVDYATANNTATAGSDYIAASGTLTFTPGITNQPITVTVQGDVVDEVNETYFVNLSNPTNATTADNQGLGTITDDDAPSPSCTTPAITLTATADTWIESAYPDNKHGTDSYLKTMPDSFTSPMERALVRFDLSSIPANSIVRCAELRVSEVDTNTAQTFYVHQVSYSWNESEATWYNRTSGDTWLSNGGDFGPTPVGSFAADATGYRSTRIDTLAYWWVTHPAANYGVLLRSTTTGDTGEVRFRSREDPNYKPLLLVDYLPTLTISDATVPEGDSGTVNAVFTATLAVAHSLTVTVDYATAHDTAEAGSDYIATSGTLTFTPGITNQTVTVAVQGDTVDELDETYFVNLSNPTNATIGSDGHGKGTITDDDSPPAVAFTAASQSGAEDVGTMTITAQLSPTVSGLDVTIPFIAGGTATSGADQDYTLTASPVMIPAGTLTTTVIIAVNDDSLDENDETVVVTMESPTNATLGATAVHTATITDNDPLPTVDFSTDSYSVDEGAGTATITVTLSAESGRTVTVNYATSDGTATAPADYTAASGTLTFTAGITTQTFTVAINDDVLEEDPETVSLDLSNPSNADLGGNDPATLTIVDNPPAVSISDVTVFEGDSGTVNAVFTVTLSAASGLIVTVDYATADNTATAGSDYSAASGILTFTSGVKSRPITITVQGDTMEEFSETYFVNLSNPTNATIADGQGLGTIADDDALTISCTTPVITLTASADTWIEKLYPNNTHGTDINLKTRPYTNQTERALIQFDLSSIPAYSAVTCAELRVSEVSTNTAQTIYVHQVTNSWDESEATWNYRTLVLPWTATGGDYNGTPEWSFAANATGYRSSNVTALAQYWANNPTANYGVLLRSTPDNDTGQVQFESRDGSNPPQLLVDYLPALSISDVTVLEGNSGTVNAVFTVTLSFADVLTVTVDYATSDNIAKAGSDYSAASGTLTFTPGITNQTTTVTVQGDNKDESDETYFVNLSGPTNATIADGQGLGTITDDDPTPTLGFSSGSYSVGEAAGGATITVTLSAESGRTVTVEYAASGGTATAGNDYKAISDTLTFVAGDTSKTFAVPIINDGLDETDETISLTLSAATNADGTPANVILTILDDDTSSSYSTYLPLIMRGGGGQGCGPDSYEPNDSCGQAHGPLTSGQTYQSWISNCDLATYKRSDYFYIDISTLNNINIKLTDIPSGTDYDLYLYRNPADDPDDPAARSIGTGNSEEISYSPQATGRYYIRVYSYNGSSTSPYSLRVTY